MDISAPVIDVSGLRSEDLAARQHVAGALGTACRDIGFFYVRGHGIEPALIEAVFSGALQLFALDDEAKDAISIRHSSFFQGYFALGQEQLDPELPADRKEAFNIGLELAPDDPRLWDKYRGPNLWPPLEGWRDIMLQYFNACWNLGLMVHRGFSLDLGIDEDFFQDKLDFPLATLRLLHYPGRRDRLAPPGAPGAGAHTDYGNLTILATDEVGGLELRRRDGTWIPAPNIPNALICNVGDCLMRWTNDTYVSTPHRVAIPSRDRYSVAFFLDPNPEATVAPLLGGNDALRRYPPISGLDYVVSRLAATTELAT